MTPWDGGRWAARAAALVTMAFLAAGTAVGDPTPGDIFGDWVYGCGPAPQGQKPSCFISQTLTLSKEGKAIGRMLTMNVASRRDDAGPRVVLLVPWGVDVQQKIQIQVDEGATWETVIQTCVQGGCRSTFNLSDQAVTTFKAGVTAKVAFWTVGGQRIVVNVSLWGFTAGLKALP